MASGIIGIEPGAFSFGPGSTGPIAQAGTTLGTSANAATDDGGEATQVQKLARTLTRLPQLRMTRPATRRIVW